MVRSSKLLLFAVLVVLTSRIAVRADGPASAATPSQKELLDLLKSNASLEQKAIACHQLAWIANRDAVPVLAGLLGDEKLSHMARYALEQIPDPSVEEALREAVPKLKGKLLAGVLASLGARRDEKSLAILNERINDADTDVASAAAYAIGKIGTLDAGKIIGETMPGAAEAVKPALWDAALRCASRLVIDGHRDEAVDLYNQLATSDATIQYRVAATRGAIIHGPRAQGMLAELLESNDRAMFNLALQLSHELSSAETTTTYVAHLGKLPAARQALLIEALGKRGDKAALPAIRAVVVQNDPAVRIAVIRALASLDDTESLGTVLEAAASPAKDISEAAIAAIVKMPGADVDAALLKMAESPDSNSRRMAIDCLARRRTTSATQALLKIAEDDPLNRQAAIRALSQVASEADLPQAIGVLEKAGSASEKTAAENVVVAICISASDKDACVEKLVAAMAHATAEQNVSMLRILAAVGGAKGLQAVRNRAGAGSLEVRKAAAEALCSWPDQAAAPDLLALAQDSATSNYNLRALRGYLRLALDVDLSPDKRLEMSAAAQPLIERDDERRLLLRVLSRVQSPKAFGMIEPLLENPAVKDDAAAAAVAVAGKLAPAADPKPFAAVVFEAMDKVKQSNPNAETLKKADDIQQRVRPLLPKKG